MHLRCQRSSARVPHDNSISALPPQIVCTICVGIGIPSIMTMGVGSTVGTAAMAVEWSVLVVIQDAIVVGVASRLGRRSSSVAVSSVAPRSVVRGIMTSSSALRCCCLPPVPDERPLPRRAMGQGCIVVCCSGCGGRGPFPVGIKSLRAERRHRLSHYCCLSDFEGGR